MSHLYTFWRKNWPRLWLVRKKSFLVKSILETNQISLCDLHRCGYSSDIQGIRLRRWRMRHSNAREENSTAEIGCWWNFERHIRSVIRKKIVVEGKTIISKHDRYRMNRRPVNARSFILWRFFVLSIIGCKYWDHTNDMYISMHLSMPSNWSRIHWDFEFSLTDDLMLPLMRELPPSPLKQSVRNSSQERWFCLNLRPDWQ
jgi:hypothetical protein